MRDLALKTKGDSDGEGEKVSLLTLKHTHEPTHPKRDTHVCTCTHVFTYKHEPKISFAFPPL